MAEPRPDRLDIPKGLESLLPRFLAEMEADARLLVAMAGGERTAFAEHAHAMRGKCAMFGALAMAEDLGELEAKAATADQREIHRLVEIIVARVGRLALQSEGIVHGAADATP